MNVMVKNAKNPLMNFNKFLFPNKVEIEMQNFIESIIKING